MIIPNKIYDILKWVCLLVIPGLATFTATLTAIWGFPFGDKIAMTITAVGVFLGCLLGISSANYNKKGDE